jgi:hypothetical protein
MCIIFDNKYKEFLYVTVAHQLVITFDTRRIKCDNKLDLEQILGAGSEFSPPYPMGYGGKTRHLLYAGTTISRQNAVRRLLSI